MKTDVRTIGIIGAMKIETELLRDCMTSKKTATVGGIEFVTGILEGKKVVTAVCGVGKVFAAMCAQAMITAFSPDIIINTGVAGSLSDKLTIGNIAIAESVVQHDMDTSALGDPVGMISGINMIDIPCDPDIAARLKKCADELGLPCGMCKIASGDRFVSDTAEKQRIVKLFGAGACEMEGAAIGQVCYVNGTPFGVIRAISDGGDESSHIDFPTFAGIASKNSAAVTKNFVKSL